MSEEVVKQYDYIFIIGKDYTQAQFLWRFIRHKYSGKVKFVSRSGYMLDGFSPFTMKMLIVFVGEHWLNPMAEHPRIRQFIAEGAEVIEEKI